MSQAIDEIRAILRDFTQSSWRDLFVRSDDWQLFLARPDGGPNPLKAGHHSGRVDEGPMAVESSVVAAPHLGLFVPACQIGEDIVDGAILGRIMAIDRATPVLATVAGAVEWLASEGEFVEYGARLAVIGS